MCAYKCVPVSVCVCGLVSLCRHCNMLVYFHIYDAAQASCVTHRGGLQFMLVFKCGGVKEREKGRQRHTDLRQKLEVHLMGIMMLLTDDNSLNHGSFF